MASTEYLADLGGPVKPGDSIRETITARRVNALTEGTRALTRGDNLAAGPGILLKKSPAGVIISAAPTARTGGTPAPRMVAVEIALDANTPPNAGDIDAALVAFYADDTAPREGDTFRLSRADNGYPEVEVRLTATELGPDWRFSPADAVTIAEKAWYKITRDISGRVHFEATGSKATVGEGGVTLLNKANDKSLTVSPSSLTENMTVRDLQVVDGSEVKLARVIASAPVSQDPPVMLPGAAYLEGGGIRFLDSETSAKYITAYLPEIANPEDQDEVSLIKLEYVDATLPGGGEGVRLRYSSRITDNEESNVRLYTDDDGVTWFFDLDEATSDLLADLESRLDSLEEYVDILNDTQDDMLANMLAMAAAVDALQSDVVTMDGRLDNAETRLDNLETDQEATNDMLIDHGIALDDLNDTVGILDSTQEELLENLITMAGVVDAHEAAIAGATISCDSSGVTLTWGEPPPSEPPPGP